MLSRALTGRRTALTRLGAGALAVAAVAALAACGGGSSGVVNSGSPTVSTTSHTPIPPPTSASMPSSSTSSSTSSAKPGKQTVTVTPSSGLRDRQQVRVHGAGFTPGEPLQIIECAAKDQATGPGDCNLAGMMSASADTSGTVEANLTVVRGPFGANKIVCDAKQQCLVSVTQATLSPTEEADTLIHFRH